MVRTDRQRGWIIYNHDESYIVMMDHTYIYMMVHTKLWWLGYGFDGSHVVAIGHL